MPRITAEQIVDLGYWSAIVFGSERKRDEAFARYEEVRRRDQEETMERWIIQP